MQYKTAFVLAHKLREAMSAEANGRTLSGEVEIDGAYFGGHIRPENHKGKPAVHGFKAPVGADADTALVEQIAVIPTNINDGRAGSDALPDDPRGDFADSAYRGNHFGDAVRAKGGTPRIVAPGLWGRDEAETRKRLNA